MGWHLGASKDHPHPTESHGEDYNNYGCLFPVHVGCSPVMPEVNMPLGSAATRPKTRLLRPPALRFAFAQLIKVAAASTTIPVTNAAMQEYSKISLRTLTIVLSTRGLLTRRGFRALEIHWTAKCYELANKEAATWDENGAVTICRASAAPPHPPHPQTLALAPTP